MSQLPTDAKARKGIPLARGLLDYFPDALCEVAELSRIGNEQHNPGEPLHWAKEKSTDEADALMRHLIDRGTVDTDGVRHSTKVAWRALAQLQREIDKERAVLCDACQSAGLQQCGRPEACQLHVITMTSPTLCVRVDCENFGKPHIYCPKVA